MLKKISIGFYFMFFALAAVINLGFCQETNGSELTPLEELGKSLYFDENLSNPPGQACAACHAPETGFTGFVVVEEDSTAERFFRNAMDIHSATRAANVAVDAYLKTTKDDPEAEQNVPQIRRYGSLPRDLTSLPEAVRVDEVRP